MPTEEKPFVCTKNGWSMQIMPRNAAGWRGFALWMLPILPITALFAWVMAGTGRDDGAVIGATVGFVLAMCAWAAAMIRWMYARSEVIDVRALLKGRDARDRRKS